MAKIVRHLRDGQMEFQKIFSKLCNTKSSWQAWSDFVEMTAISISNTFEIREDVKQERETRYMTIIKGYSKSEQSLFPQLVAILVGSLEREPEQDFLGEMFMALELGSHWKGQFFTPYSVCKMMARIDLQEAKDKCAENGYVTVNDPACGAGATLIAARNALQDNGIGGTQAFFVGQDLDRTAAMMCYIQLSLLGCAGYVVIADTLLHPVTGPMLWPNLKPEQDAWFMPLNYMEPLWAIRQSRYNGHLLWKSQHENSHESENSHENSQKCDCCHENMTSEQDEPVVEPTCHEIVTAEPEVAETALPEPEPEPKGPALQATEGGQLMLF